MLVKYGLWGFMKSNLTKSVVVLAGFALLYVLTRIPLVHVGERVVSCDSALAALLFKKGSFAYSLMKHLLSCIIPLITVAIVCKGKNILECWGLRRNFLKGWAVGLLCCIPMLVCNLIAGHVEFGWDKLFLGAVFAGLFEELIYRGFLFGVLHRYCGWRFIWAALPAAASVEVLGAPVVIPKRIVGWTMGLPPSSVSGHLTAHRGRTALQNGCDLSKAEALGQKFL